MLPDRRHFNLQKELLISEVLTCQDCLCRKVPPNQRTTFFIRGELEQLSEDQLKRLSESLRGYICLIDVEEKK